MDGTNLKYLPKCEYFFGILGVISDLLPLLSGRIPGRTKASPDGPFFVFLMFVPVGFNKNDLRVPK